MRSCNDVQTGYSLFSVSKCFIISAVLDVFMEF